MPYKLYPTTQAKHQKLHGTAGACRYVWDYFVGKLKDDYAYYGECDFSFFSIGKDFTTIRRYCDKWLQEYSAYIIKSSLQAIEICCKEFFRGNRELARCRLQKAFQAERLARANWCHHTSKLIAKQYDIAYIEGFTKGMTASARGAIENPGAHVSQKAGLNREILASVWGKLEQCLNYKMDVGKAPAHYTSQTCSQCKAVDKNNRKSHADFKCVSCGRSDNADVNVALNILAVGNTAAGRGDGELAWSVKRQKITLRHSDGA